ncbi:MAG: type II secretion system F family protein [Patescibacteria group bacterium]
MARFTYTAEKVGGEIYTGIADAQDRFELYGIVRREGGKIVAFSKEGVDNWLNFKYWNSKLTTVKQYNKILFARNLGAMLSAGLSLTRALAVLERQTKNPKLARVVTGVASDIRRGATLHDALAKFPHIFDKLFVSMVKAGEEGGSLPASLEVVSNQMERMYQLKKKVRGALIYPFIIVIAIIGIGTLMMIYVVPTLAQTFEEMNAELPVSTQIIINISNFLVEYTVLAIGGAMACLLALYATMHTAIGKRWGDLVSIHMPLIGTMVREVNAARTSRTLASLLSSGVDVLSSLAITGEVVQNSYFQDVIKDAGKSVGRGETLSSAFVRNENLYPAFVGEMMSVGEETGALSEMLKRLALFYEDEVDRKTKDLSTIIEPFLMIAIGGGVGFFAVSMITPIYSLSQNIG